MSLAVFIQYVLPHRLLSHLARWFATCRFKPWKDWLIRLAVDKFDIDVAEAADPELSHYPSFNAFFTRALKPGVRIPDPDRTSLLMPADGRMSQSGRIEAGRIFQAKGQSFSAAELLGDEAAALQRPCPSSAAGMASTANTALRVDDATAKALLRFTSAPPRCAASPTLRISRSPQPSPRCARWRTSIIEASAPCPM